MELRDIMPAPEAAAATKYDLIANVVSERAEQSRAEQRAPACLPAPL